MSAIVGPPRTTPADQCVYCPRVCPRCGYEITGGWEHREQIQAPESRHVVCSLERHHAPLVTVLDEYLTHQQNHVRPRLVTS